MMLLQARGLTKHFGGLQAVQDVDFDIERGEIHALIGPNGAGKTTLVSLLCGRLQPNAGTIRFDGRDITRLPAHVRVGLGIAYTFQITSVFERLSVFDNVALAVQHVQNRNRREHNLRSDTMRALERAGLDQLSARIAGSLSYGHQRLLEIAMGLALDPQLLILDEPTQGLANAEIDAFNSLIREVSQTATVLLIEHNIELVMDLAGRITVLDFGKVLARGAPADIRASPAVQTAYLGG